MTESQPYIHRGPHLQLLYQKIHLPMLMVRRSEVESYNILKLMHHVQGTGSFATVSQACIQMSDGS